MKRRISDNTKGGLALLVFILMTFPVCAQDAVNFSGSWSFDESKSNLGDGGQRMIAKNISINQGENSITLDRYFDGQNGEERKMTETYTLDGKESVNPMFNTTKKSRAVWSEDKKSLTVSSVVVFDMNGETTEIKTTDIYRLGDDGRTLIIDTHSTSPRGERNATLVYDKNS